MAQVLEQASTVTATPDGPIEMVDYVISLREGIMDAWGGIIGAMRSSGKSRWQAPGICGLPSFTIVSLLILSQRKLCSNTSLQSLTCLARLPTIPSEARDYYVRAWALLGMCDQAFEYVPGYPLTSS